MKYLLLIILLFSELTFASIGVISSFKGSVQIQRASQNIKATLGLQIQKNDIINTRENSNTIIKFKDNTIITIGKNSTLSIEEYIYDNKNTINSKTKFNFLKGTFKSVTGIIGKIHPEKFKLLTKTATLGIRGTTIIANQEIVACTSGEISVSTKNKTMNLSQNQYTNTLNRSKTPLILNDEILKVLYAGLAIDIYKKSNSKKDEKLILLEEGLNEASEELDHDTNQGFPESDGDSGGGAN